MQAVILAGGKGSRLKPFTTTIPKPLVPLDDTPILQIVLSQLKKNGFTDIVIAVNHLARLIMAFFGDGKEMGLNIKYSLEKAVLGTAGPLSLIEGLEDDFLVLNGDVLTTLNFADLYAFHKNSGADITIGVAEKEVKIDLGVLEISEGQFVDYIEKPVHRFRVSMGVYAINKRVVSAIPKGSRFDLPDLVLALKQQGRKIACYFGDYYWLDIGRPDDYEKAVEVFLACRKDFID